MKRLIPMLMAVCMFQVAIAQSTQPIFANNPYPRTISVSGSAEMEIVPDEIYVNVELTEYQKRGEARKDIETIKTQFLESCKAANVPDSAVSIAFYSGYNNYYNYRKKKSPDMFASITYQVKFKNSQMLDDLVEKLDDNATRNFRIVSTSHSNIIEFRKQLKIKAVQAAKAKGIYLAEAVGEELGETIMINEPEEWQPSYPYLSNAISQARVSNTSVGELNDSYRTGNEVDFKKLKLRYEVKVVFALK